ncbi:MAG TPA: OsmC family protein [Gemmatimonadales bacterium]|jgi:lipoyl-dependent peroxiredoxin|nr:OsmC family protein [Gemmatimonadales bacterium]
MATSNAVATWEGKLKEGKGTFKAQSGAFSGAFSFGTRFEGKKGSNPEELLAAAHAGCFSMALSAALEKAGHPVSRIETRAAVTIETVDGAPKVTKSELDVRGKVEGIDQAAFEQAAEGAKKNCPISKAIQNNVNITMQAKLV